MTLTAGSGSFIETAMWLGRHCLAFEIDGCNICTVLIIVVLENQYRNCVRRMNETEIAIK